MFATGAIATLPIAVAPLVGPELLPPAAGYPVSTAVAVRGCGTQGIARIVAVPAALGRRLAATVALRTVTTAATHRVVSSPAFAVYPPRRGT